MHACTHTQAQMKTLTSCYKLKFLLYWLEEEFCLSNWKDVLAMKSKDLLIICQKTAICFLSTATHRMFLILDHEDVSSHSLISVSIFYPESR